MGQGCVWGSPLKDAPLAGEFAAAQRKSAQGLFFDFFSGDPGSEDADAEADFDEFFDGVHAAQFDDCVDGELFAAKIIFDQLEGEGAFVVEDEFLGTDLLAFDAAAFGPGMFGADEELEFVGEERAEVEAFFFGRFETDSAIDLFISQKANGVERVAGFDGDLDIGEELLDFAEDGGKDVLTGGGAGADAQPGLAPLVELFEFAAGGFHLGKNIFGVREKLFTSEGEKNLFAHSVKKTAAKILFEGSNGMAYGGLGEAKLTRGNRETAVFRKGQEGAQLPAIDRTGHHERNLSL